MEFGLGIMLMALLCIFGCVNTLPMAVYYPWYSQNYHKAQLRDSYDRGHTPSRYYEPYRPYNMNGGIAAVMYSGPSSYAEPGYPREKQVFYPEEQSTPTKEQRVFLSTDQKGPAENSHVLISTQERDPLTPNFGQEYPPEKQEYPPPQQNEVNSPPQFDETPNQPTEVVPLPQVEKEEPTSTTEVPEKVEVTTIATKASTVELASDTEAAVEELKPTAKPRRIAKKKVTKPVEEDDEDEVLNPKIPMALFPMFFGYGRSGGAPSGATAIANAYSTGKGGVASSHATAYGSPREDIPR